MEHYHREAENGNVEAMVNLANAYRDGNGCEADIYLSAEWAEKAAINGSLLGMILAGIAFFILGHVQLKIGAIEDDTIENLIKSKYWLEKAVLNGYGQQEADSTLDSANNDLGDCYFVRKQYQEAFDCYSKSSTSNSAVNIAIITLGNNLPLSTSDDVFVFNKLVASLPSDEIDQEKNADGYLMLGIMYQLGIGTKQNADEGHRCLTQAKNLGCEDAIDELRKYKKKLFGGYKFVG